MPDAPVILHQDPRSGKCYKVRLVAAILGIPLKIIDYDGMQGETSTPQFRETINAHGVLPVLQVGERMLPESNSACCYLGEGSHLMPAKRINRADMLRWMFFEQINLEPNIATLRFWLQFIGRAHLTEQQTSQIMPKRIGGEEALDQMNAHLSGRDFFVGTRPTLADISLYAYTHLCEAGGFSLDDRPNIAAWLERVEALPGYIAMNDTAPGSG